MENQKIRVDPPSGLVPESEFSPRKSSFAQTLFPLVMVYSAPVIHSCHAIHMEMQNKLDGFDTN
jgi:hypothetical protein